uniref:G_PROTEIN_RECEP_F1_2 domain-containing protein n=1 Tax=Steinernema glaseri TaxID=37863 RepID=A0A1I7ZR50_9BILA
MYSLYMIVFFYIFGWLMTMCLCGVVRLLTTEPNFTVTAELSVGVFANINMAIPAFVYFTRSVDVEYKNALRRLLGRHVAAVSVIVSTSQVSRQKHSEKYIVLEDVKKVAS